MFVFGEGCLKSLWQRSCCIYPYIKWKPTPLHWLAARPARPSAWLVSWAILGEPRSPATFGRNLKGQSSPCWPRRHLLFLFCPCIAVLALLCLQDHLMNETEVAQLGFTCEAGCSKSQWQDKACNMCDTSMRLMSFNWKQCVPCAVQQATCWRPASTWMNLLGDYAQTARATPSGPAVDSNTQCSFSGSLQPTAPTVGSELCTGEARGSALRSNLKGLNA